MEKTISFNDAINELHDSIINENFTIFMGAGVSKHVNSNYPVWSGVTQKLKNELNFCFTNDALKVAQKYENKYGYEKLKETVNSLFPETTTNQSFYNELLKTRPTYLISTNWDNMLQNYIHSSLEMYDVIADDSELMNSKLYNKYLKIHGDFQHSKFVLTKKSYNSYSKDFPLTENFVKSILCTTTVLFIGYSLNDKDFQQILNWINKAAPALPKFYCALVEGYYKSNDIVKYNKNNIKTFIVSNITDIFKTLNNINVVINNKKPIKAFYELLSPLKNDKAILLSSIQHFLTNTYFNYPTENITFAWLQVDSATYDYNEERRKIFKNFINSFYNQITDEENEILSKISFILMKANIMGIINEGFIDKTNNNIVFLPTNNLLQFYDKSKAYKNFNYEIYNTDEQRIVNIYENIDYYAGGSELIETAFELNKIIIQKDINDRNYRKLFISYYNLNVLQQTIFNVKMIPCNKQEDSIDLYKKFNNLPKKLQNEVFDIYNFVNGNTLKSLQIELQNTLKKLLHTVENIKNGGMAFDNSKFQYANKHKNLNDFVLLNNILIDHDFSFVQVERLFFKIALVRKSVSPVISFNRNEIFTAIKFFNWDNNEQNLYSLLKENGIQNIELTQDDEDWLINIVLPNCAKIYKNSEYGNTKPYFSNLLVILSFANLKKENTQMVATYLKNLFAFSICDEKLLSLTIQFIETKIKIDNTIFNEIKIMSFYKILITKWFYNKISPTIGISITENNYLAHFLYLGSLNSECFTDLNYIRTILKHIQHASLDQIIGFYTNQLCVIYAFCSEDCKSILKNILLKYKKYLLRKNPPYGVTMFNQVLSNTDFTRLKLKYLITLFQLKIIKFTNELYLEIYNWLINELNSSGYQSSNHELVNLINNLKTNNKKIKTIRNLCNKIILKYKNRPRISSI